MKYFNIPTIKRALVRLNEGDTNEHRTGSVTSGLLQNYFPVEKYIVTPEQIQYISRKRPDFTVEKLENNNFVFHLFVEIKGLINSDFPQIMDQLHDTILHAVDNTGGSFSVFAIAMKGSKIAFFLFYSYGSLLDDYGIMNYNGFIPLNYRIPYAEFAAINHTDNLVDYLRYLNRLNFITDPHDLSNLGVESTKKIPHAHI
jgi:hypothetical protein